LKGYERTLLAGWTVTNGPSAHDVSVAGAAEPLGALLTRLRLTRGLSQARLAEELNTAAGVPTVSRHEVSQWEREQRLPSSFWLRWLSTFFDVPLEQLESARACSKEAARPGANGGQTPDTTREGGSSAAPVDKQPAPSEADRTANDADGEPAAAADFDHSRRTAYAAVTASFDDDSSLIVKLVRELVESPTDAASGLLALIQACGAMAELWANAIQEEPVKAWAKYASTVAWVVSQPPGTCDQEGEG
jgi:transcriptional regulator with XRE-family HTH domain